MLKCIPVLGAIALLLFSRFSIAIEQVSGINQIAFNKSQYDKAFVGNGFLIRHNGVVYAVTVKHVLLEAKTPSMSSVSIEDKVKTWRIHPNQDSEHYIELGKLLNSSTQEALDMSVLQRDWLVFEVKENRSNLKVLTLRDTPLKPGETLIAHGCSYYKAKTCKQDAYKGDFVSMEANNLRIKMPKWSPGKLRGLSGSPVLDRDQRVVGIVSNVLRSSDGQGFDFAPANLVYLRQVLDSL